MPKLDNYIICIVGKSGSGKTTIVDKLADAYDYKVLVSYTTRPPRTVNANDHIYISKDEYDKLQNKVAWTEFDNNFYCCTKEQIDVSDLYVIDLNGLHQLKQMYNGNKKIISIYIDVPMEICLERMLKRGDSEDKCWERLRHDYDAFQYAKEESDYVMNGIPECTWYDIGELIERVCGSETN